MRGKGKQHKLSYYIRESALQQLLLLRTDVLMSEKNEAIYVDLDEVK